jgi:hypothetical protein
MAQVKSRTPSDKRYTYNLMVNDTKEQVDTIEKNAAKYDREGMKEKDLNAMYKRIVAANIYLDTIELYCRMNECMQEVMETKNDKVLSDARKNIYQTLKLLESIVGNYIDTPLTENVEVMESLKLLTPTRLLHLVRKIEYAITYLEHEEGGDSKWKSALVDIYGKFAALTKNLINFREFNVKMYDPSYPYYDEVIELIGTVKRVINTAASKFRDKYALSTGQVADMKKAIEFLNLLVRIHIILNEQEMAQDVKKRIEVWSNQLEIDQKKKEEEDKRAKQAAMAAAKRK